LLKGCVLISVTLRGTLVRTQPHGDRNTLGSGFRSSYALIFQ
jgi:hypothetical protein